VKPVPAVAAIVLSTCLALPLTAAPRPDRARVAYVIDGDTFRLAGGERIRIAGIDAPETHRGQARCRAEVALGNAATARARAMLDGRSVAVVRLGRSYNRTVARVTLDGRDLAAELVRAGAARWWPRGARKPDWCGRRSR
jgi:micrococcal nuclease